MKRLNTLARVAETNFPEWMRWLLDCGADQAQDSASDENRCTPAVRGSMASSYIRDCLNELADCKDEADLQQTCLTMLRRSPEHLQASFPGSLSHMITKHSVDGCEAWEVNGILCFLQSAKTRGGVEAFQWSRCGTTIKKTLSSDPKCQEAPNLFTIAGLEDPYGTLKAIDSANPICAFAYTLDYHGNLSEVGYGIPRFDGTSQSIGWIDLRLLAVSRAPAIPDLHAKPSKPHPESPSREFKIKLRDQFRRKKDS